MSKLVEMPVQARDLPAQNAQNMGEKEVTLKKLTSCNMKLGSPGNFDIGADENE